MKRRKGQFMVISAVLIGLTVLSTATMIHDMQTRPITSVDEGYTLHSVFNQIEETGSHVEEWRLLERSLQYRPGYRSNITFWSGSSPDHANITFDGAQASLTGSKPVKGINSRFVFNDSIPEPGEGVEFQNVSELSPSHTGDTAEWFIDGVKQGSGETLEHSFSDAGFYNVSLKVNTTEGDTDTEYREIQIGTLTANVDSTNSPIRYGSDNLEVVVEVVNDGAENRSETLDFEVNDTDTGSIVSSDSVEFNLPPRFSDQFTFTWDPEGNPPDDSGTGPGDGRYEVVVRIPDVEKRKNIRVLP